ncbi:putative DNA ligase (ATP) [Helianthus anomalus]
MKLFFEKAFHSSCEGMMVKSLDVEAGYLPSKRSDSWLKVLRRDYVEGLNDSLDLVPIGAWSYCEWGTDFLNDRLQEGFLKRIRYAMKPDEAYGLIFSWDNVMPGTQALKLSAWEEFAREEGKEIPEDDDV